MRTSVYVLSLFVAACAQSPRADTGEPSPPPPAAAARDTTSQLQAGAVGGAIAPDLSACFAQAQPEPSAVNRRSPQSPPDSTCASVGGATLAVRYARPSMRGRQIFGGLEPYGRVWRAGANAATGFTTTRDLVMNGATVPAGAYTLYAYIADTPNPPSCSAPVPAAGAPNSEWQLIVNKQTGQWGTEYSQAEDLVRIPMRVCRPDAPVEQFEIRITPRGVDAGTMMLLWENTAASADFTVKR